MSDRGPGRYPADALRADGLRTVAGLALTLGPVLLAGTDTHPLVAMPLLAGAGLFGGLGLRTLWRRQAHFDLTAEGLRIRDGFATILLPWGRVTGVRLRFYATKKDRSDGWMHMTLLAGHRRYRIESHLIGFDAIAARVATLVTERALPVDQTSRENFLSLGQIV